MSTQSAIAATKRLINKANKQLEKYGEQMKNLRRKDFSEKYNIYKHTWFKNKLDGICFVDDIETDVYGEITVVKIQYLILNSLNGKYELGFYDRVIDFEKGDFFIKIDAPDLAKDFYEKLEKQKQLNIKMENKNVR